MYSSLKSENYHCILYISLSSSICLFNSFQLAFGPQSSPDTSFTRVNKSFTYYCRTEWAFFSTSMMSEKHEALESNIESCILQHNTAPRNAMPAPGLPAGTATFSTVPFSTLCHASQTSSIQPRQRRTKTGKGTLQGM